MSNQGRLDELNQQVAACQQCPLYQSATRAVPGAGNPQAEIMFIGEAPGYHEDQQGLPFVGASGKLLNQSLSQIGLDRSLVFIANILKHRPPNNRDPKPEEIKACTPYLKQQIQIIQPKVIVTLGRFALNYFIPNLYISRVHGQPRQVTWEDLRLLLFPMYHPSAGLRSTRVKNDFLADFDQLKLTLAKSGNNTSQSSSKPEPSKQTSLFS